MKAEDFMFTFLIVSLWPFLICSRFISSWQSYSSNPDISSVAKPLRTTSIRLGKPLVRDDGRVYSCAGKEVYAFESNRTIAWKVHLNVSCSIGIAPVYGGRKKIYVVAEKTVLRINTLNIGTQKPVVELFLALEPGAEDHEEFIGLCVSMFTSSVYINIRHRGLFSYTSRGQLAWNVGPVLHQFGYHQGCKENVTGCFFTSVPVIDQCEASIYVANNEGQLYSLSTREPRFKWIQDFSLYDTVFTITPGNDGRLYVTVPAKSMLFVLDAAKGDILWKISIGPLSSVDSAPVVDSNGWISMGSLDGFLYSVSPMGILNKFSKSSVADSVIQVSPIIDCSGYAVYIAQTELERKTSHTVSDNFFISAMKPKTVNFTLLVPATGSIYWSETYPGRFSSFLHESDLRNFILDEGVVLAFIATSRTGNLLPCRTTREKLAASCSQARTKSLNVYTGSERAILLFLVFQTALLLVLAIAVWFCRIFWAKRKLQNQGLGVFLEKRRLLRLRKKELDRTITALEQRAAEEATTSDVLEKLSNLLRGREGVKKKLSTTYSLGRDEMSTHPKSLLPLYDAKTKSYSFKGPREESVTIFHNAYTDTSSTDISEETATSEYSAEENMESCNEDPKGKRKEKAPLEVASSSDDDGYVSDFHSSLDMFSMRTGDIVDPIHIEHGSSEQMEVKANDDEAPKIKRMQSGGRSIRRRTLSSTY
ncbi:hypothetical protein Droror1_Dr00011947 [Drosera rotundifolia]